MKFAAAHPGKIGDLLYILPSLRYIYEATRVKFDVYTSEYCLPVKELFEYQECVSGFYVAPDYIIERMDMGIQPWYVPIPNPEQYARIYQLGFRTVPDRMLHQFIGEYAGISEPLAIKYDVPKLDKDVLFDVEYYVIAPRGRTTFEHIFNELVQKRKCVVVGAECDYTGYGFDYTGHNFLETASVIAQSKGFVGLMSSQLVLANGFPIPRIGLNGLLSDMRHAITYHLNYYPSLNASTEDIIAMLDKHNH
jgi:hypothetical protein